MIPTTEIEALAERCRKAIAPLPYQQARLLPKLRRDRPLRFAAVEVEARMVSRLAQATGLTARLFETREAHVGDRTKAHWPAEQILELCDLVMCRAAQAVAGLLRFLMVTEVQSDEVHEGSPTAVRLKTTLLDLPFVDSVRVEENNTLDTVDGMPPRSVRVTIGPNLQEDERQQVAETIDSELPVGIETCSTAGPGWCVVVGDRTIQFNEAEPHCGDDLVDSFALAVKAGALDGVKVGIDYGLSPAPLATVSTFEMTESGPVLTGVREATPDEAAEIKATFEATEQDGRIHYTDEPPRALKEGFDEAVRQVKREPVDMKATLTKHDHLEMRHAEKVDSPDRRERLRREMTKGKW